MIATPTKTGYASVNRIELYYEIYGEGQPLILLHGGVGAIEMFTPILPLLAEGRQVIGVDLQAHGRTADIDRALSSEAMADDVAALIKHLGFEQVDLMGYSMGGGVALQTAIRHPELIRKLIVVSFAIKSGGWYPEILAGMAQMGPEIAEPMKQTPMYKVYAEVAPRPDDWSKMLSKIGDMMRREYDWSSSVIALKMPVLVVIGDGDSVRTSHAVEFFELLGGGKVDGAWDKSGLSKAQLAILPGMTHYEIFESPALAAAAIGFLDAPVREV